MRSLACKMSMISLAGCLLVGCTIVHLESGIVPPLAQISNNNYATFFVARKQGYIAHNVALPVLLNGQPILIMSIGSKASFKVPADVEMTIGVPIFLIPDYVTFTPERGKKYYFATDCNPFACWFDEMNEIEYRKIAATCKEELKLLSEEEKRTFDKEWSRWRKAYPDYQGTVPLIKRRH